jgi:xanthine dehydrogenase molybdenum-binding subunit
VTFAVIGKGTPKRDGPEKVTGRTQFLHDLVLPRMLHGRILRAQHPHARLVRIDASRARALPGVVAVITGEDVEQHPFGFLKDQLALKRDKVRCIRDEVVAVAAETPSSTKRCRPCSIPARLWSRARRSCTKRPARI